MASGKRDPFEKALVGPAGEHYVLYRLYRRGILASLVPPGTPAADILVLNTDESIVATIQVKTRTFGRDGGWHMREKHESIVGEKYFYIFVDFEPDVPNIFIIPSKVVAKVISESHKAWLATPGKNGRAHKDSKMRRIEPGWNILVKGFENGWMNEYHERWDLLQLATKLS